MFFYENTVCPVCGQTFSENDDIVACPQCGTPHHRACWQQEGHCHNADKHADGYQWERAVNDNVSRASADASDRSGTGAHNRVCERCDFANPFYADFCSRCGSPLKKHADHSQDGYGEYAPIHAEPPLQCGSVDPYTLIEDIPAKDVATLVRFNTPYYLPRFVQMSHNRSFVNWNWAAFLFGPYWLLYRKCYLFGILFWALLSSAHILQSLITQLFLSPVVEAVNNGQNIVSATLQFLESGALSDTTVLIIQILGGITFLLHLICGLCGNRMYMYTCTRHIRRLRAQTKDGYRALLSTGGGVSLFIGWFFYVAIQLINSIVVYFLS